MRISALSAGRSDWPRSIRQLAEQNLPVGDSAGKSVQTDQPPIWNCVLGGFWFEHFSAVDDNRDFTVDHSNFERVPLSRRLHGVFTRTIFPKERTGRILVRSFARIVGQVDLMSQVDQFATAGIVEKDAALSRQCVESFPFQTQFEVAVLFCRDQ